MRFSRCDRICCTSCRPVCLREVQHGLTIPTSDAAGRNYRYDDNEDDQESDKTVEFHQNPPIETSKMLCINILSYFFTRFIYRQPVNFRQEREDIRLSNRNREISAKSRRTGPEAIRQASNVQLRGILTSPHTKKLWMDTTVDLISSR